MKYTLIRAHNNEPFVESVNDMLTRGYELFGSPFSSDEGYWLNQAMILTDKEERDEEIQGDP